MVEHEGLVATLKEDGKAEVLIRPGRIGIPGAPEAINRRVCHCASDGSTVKFEALNRVGAGVGDWVAVRRDTTMLMKNAAALLGIPAMGLILGIVIAVFITHQFTFHIIGGVVVIIAFFYPGIVLGVSIYKRVSAGNEPVIERIIRKRSDMIPPSDGKRPFQREGGETCAGCAVSQ